MFTALEIIPTSELKWRQERFCALLREKLPEAGGMLIFSRTNIYYFTGTYAVGILWLPVEGAPVLLVRKGIERVHLETSGLTAGLYRSYSDLPETLKSLGSPITDQVAVEEGGLSWTFGLNLSKRLSHLTFLPADHLLQRTRSVKSAWELNKLREAGKRHYETMSKLLPAAIQPGMNEYEISRILWDICFSLGHSGTMRMSAMGEEIFLGHITVGENSAYPSYYNGPIGVKGVHPAASYMGSPDSIWNKGSMLAIDMGFVWEGYNSDKTQLYFAGGQNALPHRAWDAQRCTITIQKELAAMLKPGTLPQDLYKRSLEIAEQCGFSDGYMGVGGNKVPFVGHGIGLNVDEWPVLANNFIEPLQEGMVLAIEPKITLPELAPAIGMVGVENTFIVTKDGGQSITSKTGNLDDDSGDIIFIG